MNLALRQEASCHSAFVCVKATPPRSRLVTAIIDDWISQQSNESIAKPKDKLQLLLGGLYLRRSPRVCLFRTPSNSIWGISSSSAVFVSKWSPVTCLWMHPCNIRTPAAARSLRLCGPCPAGRTHYRLGCACAVFSPSMLGYRLLIINLKVSGCPGMSRCFCDRYHRPCVYLLQAGLPSLICSGP